MHALESEIEKLHNNLQTECSKNKEYKNDVIMLKRLNQITDSDMHQIQRKQRKAKDEIANHRTEIATLKTKFSEANRQIEIEQEDNDKILI